MWNGVEKEPSRVLLYSASASHPAETDYGPAIGDGTLGGEVKRSLYHSRYRRRQTNSKESSGPGRNETNHRNSEYN